MDLVKKEFFMGVTPIPPPAVPNLGLWLDGADSSQIVFGTAPSIATWKDKSSHANNASQATATKQPTQHVAAQNGLNTVHFTTAAAQLFTLTSPLSLAAGYTAFCVLGKGVSNNIMVPLGSSTLAQAYVPLWYLDMKIYTSGTACRAISNAENTPSYNLISCGQNAAENSGFVRFNRSDITANPSDTTTTSLMTSLDQIGATLSIGGTDGDIAEYFIYPSVLTFAQIQGLENYLKLKWATP